jgi:phosphoribosylaminoimidazolecarboxamide formyltransferase/IMP cyclohydrolase
MFYEIVVAPGYTEKGLAVLKGKSKTLRILEAKESEKGMLSLRQVSGGWLAQESDDLAPEDITFTTVSQKAPTDSELSDAKFAWLCVKHVKSNAIVIAKVSVFSRTVPRFRNYCCLHHRQQITRKLLTNV